MNFKLSSLRGGQIVSVTGGDKEWKYIFDISVLHSEEFKKLQEERLHYMGTAACIKNPCGNSNKLLPHISTWKQSGKPVCHEVSNRHSHFDPFEL